MILQPDNDEHLRISIYLKDGREFINRNVTRAPFGDFDRVVSCWNEKNTKVLIFPMADVDHVELDFRSPEERV